MVNFSAHMTMLNSLKQDKRTEFMHSFLVRDVHYVDGPLVMITEEASSIYSVCCMQCNL